MGEGWQIPGMYHRLLVHIVWTTRDRAPTLDLPRARFLAGNLRVIVRQERGHLLEVGIVPHTCTCSFVSTLPPAYRACCSVSKAERHMG